MVRQNCEQSHCHVLRVALKTRSWLLHLTQTKSPWKTLVCATWTSARRAPFRTLNPEFASLPNGSGGERGANLWILRAGESIKFGHRTGIPIMLGLTFSHSQRSDHPSSFELAEEEDRFTFTTMSHTGFVLVQHTSADAGNGDV